MEEDVFMEPLPEPLLLILSPPPPFLPTVSQPVMVWPKWLKAFERYMRGLGETDLPDSSKLVLLQNCLGTEGERVFRILIRNESTYAAAVGALTSHFNSSSTSQMHRLKFHQRVQMPGETADQFVSALEELAIPCKYRKSKHKVILDQLINKTNSAQLRESLLMRRTDLTLPTALAFARDMELLLEESPQYHVHEVSVDIGEDFDPPVPIKRKRGRPRREEQRLKAETRAAQPPVKPPTRKDEYYYSNDKLYYENDGEDPAPEESDGACSVSDDGEKEDPVSLLRVKEEDSGKDSDDAEDAGENEEDDDDFVLPSTKLKGPVCPICPNRRFRNAHKLGRHMRTHTKEKPFTCPLCSKTFSQSYHMTRHMRNLHGAAQHICATCGESLESCTELQKHKKTHRPKVLLCLDCNEKFTNAEEFSAHVKSHSAALSSQEEGQSGDQVDVKTEEPPDDPEDGVCPDTEPEVSTSVSENGEAESENGGQTKQKATAKSRRDGHFCPICVNRHFKGSNKLARHMRTHTKEKPFACPVCEMTFSQSYHMTRHVRNQHGLGQHICSKCGKSFDTWLDLKVHKKTHAIRGLTCFACDKQFKGEAALANHLKLHRKVESSPRSLVCSDCGKEFGRMYHLKRHLMTHRKGATAECYTCPDCQKVFVFPEDLNKHLENHVKENKGLCPKCNESFTTAEELEAHMSVHQKSYSCSICGKKFKVEYARKKHEQGHQTEQYFCSLCQKHFLKLSHYKRHVLVHNRRESKCPHCDSVFLQLTAFKYHLRTHTEERPYQCSCCIESFQQKEDLEQHCLKHRKFKKQKPYSCTRCDSAFSTLVELTEHMSLHEGEPPQTCPVCGKSFLNKNKLEKHLSIHTGERPHLCSICGNGFPSAASLKLHAHIHTGEKPFQCKQCSKKFSSNSGLRLHSRQHMDQRPSYECPECGRTYGRMTELKMHQRYHTGDKPYACTCCSKRFISKDKLMVHMRTHTGERPYSCPHCGQTFTQTGDRNRHISKQHSNLMQ